MLCNAAVVHHLRKRYVHAITLLPPLTLMICVQRDLTHAAHGTDIRRSYNMLHGDVRTTASCVPTGFNVQQLLQLTVTVSFVTAQLTVRPE